MLTSTKRVYTLITGKKYPPWYVDAMAKFLKRFDTELHVFTEKYPKDVGNVAVIHDASAWPMDWWGKLKFFDSSEFEEGETVLFVDVDTLFMQDPAPIFEWIKDDAPEAAFITDPLPYLSDHAGSSMFVLNHESPNIRKMWEIYRKDLEKGAIPRETKLGYLYGDQDYITDKLPEAEISWKYLPKYFQGQHKAFFNEHIHAKAPKWLAIWQEARAKYGYIQVEDLISIHFIGTRNPQAVWKRFLGDRLRALKHPVLFEDRGLQ